MREKEGGEPCGEKLFQQAWLVLRRALIRELRRRGLWQTPAAFLGITGDRWTERSIAGPTASLFEDDPLDELVAAAYEFVFVDRLSAICDQLEIKPSIDGLVFLNLRHFLCERQRRYDPLGYRIFKVLRQAITRAVEDGEWAVVAGDPKVHNETVLGVEGGSEEPDDGTRVAKLAGTWAESLMPALVTAQGKAQRRLVLQVREAIVALPEHGIECFRCGDLIRGLRHRSRQLWTSIFDVHRGPTAFAADSGTLDGRVTLVLPDLGFQDRNSFEALLNCVSWKIAHAGHGSDEDLPRLWHLLSTFAQDEDAGKVPSRRQLARLLEIPRDRLPGLLRLLGNLIEDCHRHVRNAAVSSSVHALSRQRQQPTRKDRP
ncbi:MAG: hypothetical protein AAF657_04870 [Acidobacteriota bacterium]